MEDVRPAYRENIEKPDAETQGAEAQHGNVMEREPAMGSKSPFYRHREILQTQQRKIRREGRRIRARDHSREH
jgi:hypothetical protein